MPENGPLGPPAKVTRSGRFGFKSRLADDDTREVDESTVDLTQQALHDAYAEYRAAMRAWRAAGRSHDGPVTQAADGRLLSARVALYQALLDSGWCPPEGLRAQLERDAALIDAPEAPADFDALLGV